jgi:integrase
MTSLPATGSLPAGSDNDQHAARLWDALDEEFLAVVGWDPVRHVVTFPREHPRLGCRKCSVPNCEKATRAANGICVTCDLRRKNAGDIPLADFIAIPKPYQRCIGVVPCAVGRCERPAKTTVGQLCTAHNHQRTRILGLPLQEFLAHPGVVPLPSFGPCKVVACTRDRVGHGPYCQGHKSRLNEAKRRNPGLDEEAWQRTVPAVAEGSQISLRGLPPLVVAEVLYGVQQRTRSDIKTSYRDLRPLCDLLRATSAASVADLTSVTGRRHVRTLVSAFAKSAGRLAASPEAERHKDVWDLFVFGHGGSLTFTGISQPWLREAVKRWAFDDLPRRRGDKVASVVQQRVNSIGWLSESLRLQRADRGDVISALGRGDITAFCNRLAYLASQGKMSGRTRVIFCRHVRHVLDTCRKMSLTRPGQPLHNLPDDFALREDDIPDEPEDEATGRDLPAEVMRNLTAHLDQLEASNGKEVRVGVELLMDTGRRPGEIASLWLDCLEADPDGKPSLVYDNHKENREGRRLPIAAGTAAVITGQQERVRARFPGTPDSQLRLLPSGYRNPAGRRHISDNWITDCHRAWVDSLPEVAVPTAVEVDGKLVTQMLPFSKEKIFCYAYRHTYAQRHADAGVDVTVLQELMDHRRITTTQGYYRVGAERRREAVDRVTEMQFDRKGNRVWRQAGRLLASEHARLAVGEVAVPYGRCTEPGNVAACGEACPLRYRCLGCGHFHTDISYLPDLEQYLSDLLRQREKLLAGIEAEEWARDEAMPSDNEITCVRRLISRMKTDLDDLTDAERAEIEEAVAIVRRGKSRITSLGMPKIRQPLPDLYAERTG